MNQRKTGGEFEKLAADFLIKHGYKILERNFRCRMGEIDIVAMDGHVLVFIEVKYRSSMKYGGPMPAVNLKKQQTISKVALYYLIVHELNMSTACRFDVVGIIPGRITLQKNAFPFRKNRW